MLLSLILIFVLGYLGYRVFNFLHIPGGAVTGSLVTLAIITSQGYEWQAISSYLLTFFQVIIGAMIGCRFKKEQVPIIMSIIGPGLLSSAWMILISLVIGYLLSRMTGIDLGTALYASVPAGLFEMGLIALSLNLSVPIVTLMQFVRVISINLSLPVIASHCNNWDKHSPTNCQLETDKEKINSNKITLPNHNKKEKTHLGELLLVLFIGSIGGFTAKFLGIPVGGMLGSMLVVGALRISGIPLKELPQWLILITQIIVGGYLGTTFVPEMLATLKTLLLPVIFFSFFVVLNGILIGIMFHRILKWDLATALLATAAGGVTLMTLTAVEINADPVRVSILQSLRIIIILLIMPALILNIIY